MPKPHKYSERDLLKKYKKKLERELSGKRIEDEPFFSVNYLQFKKENLPRQLNLYEKLCNAAEKIIRIRVDKKTEQNINDSIDLCHLSASASGVVSFAVLAALLIIALGGITGYFLFDSVVLVIFFLITGMVFLTIALKLPELFANTWRLKASNQMIECIFYVVTYMRHTSNLELAINFAAEHLAPPLSIDLKKVLWDVEIGKHETIKESLDIYLESWRKWNIEFIEAFHLIEGSLYEGSEDRRLKLIDKSLEVMLQETYEKMLHYAHELKNPITTLYMLGIVLPILGLVILPLVASFLASETLTPNRIAFYLAILYNFMLPIGIYYFGRVVLSKRPTGYGETDISEDMPELKKYKKIHLKIGKKDFYTSPLTLSLIIGALLLFIGLLPVLVGSSLSEQTLMQEKETFMGFKLLEYRQTDTGIIGPYGLGAAILSIFVPLSFALGVGIYFNISSKNVIKIRDKAKQLEEEFASSLFQLGNRMGDGLPAEIAFGKVAELMKDTTSGEFFRVVTYNIRRLGMSVKQAIFNPRNGALLYFPSSLIESSMKVLIESAKKGPMAASQALINVSEYVKDIHRVNERLKDLLSEIISDMKQQANFLAPVISGIVVGITSMIVTILGKLTQQLAAIGETTGTGTMGAQVPTGILNLFGNSVPTYYFQIIVGIYIVQIIYVLTVLINGIENGSDKLAERYNLGQNLIRGSLLYAIIALFVMVVFNTIASGIMTALV